MKTAPALYRFVRQGLLPVVAVIMLAGVDRLHAQNVDITNWNPAASVIRSEDVRIRHVSETFAGFDPADGFFDPDQPETIGLIKSENSIYVRFRNNSANLAVIPEPAVTVTVDYAEADPGLADADLAAEAAAVPVVGWRTIGSYTMDLEILVGDPPGYGLLPGATYPTIREDDEFPNRYRVVCTVDCSQPLPTSFFLRATLTLAGDTDLATNVAFSYYDLTEGAPRADVVILHDVSGSMIGQLPFAQQRAKMFVDLMNPGDRVGVVAFSTAFPGNSSLAASLGVINTIDPSDPAKSFAKAGIDSFVANGGTPMGSGVLRAQEVLNAALPPYPPNRAIVMLTDGMENVDPRLQNPPLYPILNGLNTDPNGGIALFPLWFGTMSHWGRSLLEDVTTHVDRGKLVDQPDDDLKLAEAYLMIRGILTSDDVYAIHRGASGDGYEAAIDVDEVTNELILTVAWHNFQQELEVSVLPPGGSWQAAGSLATSTSRDQLYVVHRFTDPQAGVWRYRLARPPKDEPYVLAALADKVEILMQSDLADNSVAAGEPLVINARLTRQGRPVTGAVIRARIEAPQQSLGTILNGVRDRLTTPLQADPSAEVPRAAGILGELREILGNEAIFTYAPGTIALTDADGDGVYTGRFEDTRVAGTYNITITAESIGLAGSEGFRREHRHSAVVSLGRLDAERSIVAVTTLDRSDQSGSILRAVTVTPVDVFGNFIDPGYGARLQVEATGGRWAGTLVDNQDGSYTRVLQLAPGETADVTVTAFGQALPPRSATGGGGGAGGRREISFHAGIVQPAGSLDDLLDRGSSLTLDLGYHFSSRLTALLLVGLHDFPRADGGSERVWQISADLRHRLSSQPLSFYVQGGPGAYRMFGDWDVGANLGIGLTYSASPAVDLEWGVDFHDVFRSGDDARFWQLHIGSSIDF